MARAAPARAGPRSRLAALMLWVAAAALGFWCATRTRARVYREGFLGSREYGVEVSVPYLGLRGSVVDARAGARPGGPAWFHVYSSAHACGSSDPWHHAAPR